MIVLEIIQMSNKTIKVEVNKVVGFIRVNDYIKTFNDTPTTVYHTNDLDFPLKFIKCLSTDQILIQTMTGYMIYKASNIVVRTSVVRFKDIEDYTHYQTELDFDESV